MPVEYHRRDLIATGAAVLIILTVFIPSILVHFNNVKDGTSSSVEKEGLRSASDSDPWYREAQNSLKETLRLTENVNKPAKNIIIFLGDGMGISSLTAARYQCILYQFVWTIFFLVVLRFPPSKISTFFTPYFTSKA